MTTDITELAQIAKIKKQLENFDTVVLKEDEAVALVEALEKAQRANAAQDDHINQQQDHIESLEKKNAELGKYAGDLEAIRAAAEKLVRCKGRYHSEQNYRALAALFGVNTPDLPPLEHENVHYADAAETDMAVQLANAERKCRELAAELESTEKQNAMDVQIKARLCRESNSLHDRLRTAENRIAELEESHAQVIQSRDHYKRMTEEGLKQLAESRTVKLPPTVSVAGIDVYEAGLVRILLTAAGIKWEGGVMANSLLEICNGWQIQRAEILARNPDMALTIQQLDMMVEHAVRSAINISHRVDWDFREAERVAKQHGETE